MSSKEKNSQDQTLSDNDKNSVIKTVLKQTAKEYGDAVIMQLNEKQTFEKVGSISTGSLNLDRLTGIGGIPKGRITEIYGQEGSGKTTITLGVIANSQKKNGICVFIDVEHALDIKYAEKLGVNLSKLILVQPSSAEQALEIMDTFIRSKVVDVIILDSVAALVPKAELEGDMGDATMGSQARLMSQALRKMTHSISDSNCAVMFVNQIRSKIGVMFGNPETTTGGNALKFYASMRMEIKRRGLIKKQEKVVGQEVEVKICKNKFFPPFRNTNFEIIYGEGINWFSEVVDISLSLNIIEKQGSWYSYKNQKIGQGKENAIIFLKTNPQLCKEIVEQLDFNQQNIDQEKLKTESKEALVDTN